MKWAIGLHVMLNGIVFILMTIGITRAAIHFDRISILWFYIVPLIGMSVNFKKDGDSDE